MDFLTVFLTILKVLGIIIGAVLVLVILIVLALRFGRIHYKASVIIHDDNPEIRVRLSILYPFLYVFVNFIDGELLYDARIFRISYFYKDIKKGIKREKKDKEKIFRLSEEDHSLIDDLLDFLTKESEEEKGPEEAAETGADPANGNASGANASNTNRKTGTGGFFSNIITFFRNFPEIVDNVIAKCKVAWGYIKDFRNMFEDRKNKEALEFIWNTIKAIIAYIFEKRHTVRIRYGDEEPDVTAERFGLICSVGAYFGAHLETELYPGEDIFDLDADFNDYVKIYPVLLWVLDLYKNDRLVDVITKIS